MGIHLNRGNSLFISYRNCRNYKDKTNLINFTNQLLNTNDRFICVTRPSRFGKTSAIAMLNDYYSKGFDSKEIFDNLNISSNSSYKDHLNKHNVILLDTISIHYEYETYKLGFDCIEKEIIKELKEEFPDIDLNNISFENALIKINKTTNEKFIFLIDYWDIFFRESETNKEKELFISFMAKLLKNKDVASSIELFYMTGKFPTIYYENFTNEISLFKDYSILFPGQTAQFFGYTENEIIELCKKYNFSFDIIKKWYKGYNLNGLTIYNPISVEHAIKSKDFSYDWCYSRSIGSLNIPLNFNNGELKEDTLSLLMGKSIHLDISNNLKELIKSNSKESALVELIHQGYLTYDYDKKECRITNYEIRKWIGQATEELNWKEISDPIDESMALYNKTLKGCLYYINVTLDENYNSLISLCNKINENILNIIIPFSYFESYTYYDVKCIKLDESSLLYEFVPIDNKHTPMTIEYNIDKPLEIIINQIKEKDYSSVFKGYKGKILLLGITYDSSTLKHESKIEYIEL